MPEYRQLRFAPPPGAATILLVRHGESEPLDDDRPFPLLDGQGDPALAPEGHEQARLVCARLALEAVDAVYVTSLRRTAQTAAPLVASPIPSSNPTCVRCSWANGREACCER